MRYIIAHGHIFKNAGSTFDWCLKRNLGNAFLDHRDDDAMMRLGANHMADLVSACPAMLAISSHHLTYPLPEMRNVSFIPVYFLRHPIERIESVYYFERQQDAETPGARHARRLSFRDYVEWRMQIESAPTIRDYQCYNLVGEPGREVSPDFQTALGRVQELACPAVVDRFDESMVLMEARFPGLGVGPLDLSYIVQNRTAFDPQATLEGRISRVEHELGDLIAPVRELNRRDLALYQAANQALDEAIATIPDFPNKLREFRRRCTLLAQS